MKKVLFLISLLMSVLTFAQNKGITYQAVIYSTSGESIPGIHNSNSPLVNKLICLQFSIVDDNTQTEYQEKITVTTDDFGMVNLTIGNGTQTGGYASSFNTIVWSNSKKYLKVSLDQSGACSTFEEISNQLLTYVPFALAADSATSVSGIVGIANGGTNATTVIGAKTNLQLQNVDNTSDVNKPISAATQTALNLKAPINNPTFTGTVSGITKAMIGLTNVDNTSDLNKPISIATQTAVNLKEDVINKSTDVTVDGTSDSKYPSVKAIKSYVDNQVISSSVPDATSISKGKIQLAGDLSGTALLPTVPGLALKAPINNPTFTGTVSGVTKAMVGLGNVDNTSDLNKPISTVTQTALNSKVDKVVGKNLSTEDFTTAEKTKLAAISGVNTGDQDLSAYALNISPMFAGIPTAPTAISGTNTNQIATTAFVNDAVSNLSGGNSVDLTTNQTVAGVKTFSPVLTAVADNTSLVGLNINPQFNEGSFSGINKTALKLKGDLSFTEGTNFIKFANGSMVGDVQNNGTDPTGTVDLYAPEGASWIQMNYGNRNYFWMDNVSSYLSTGRQGVRQYDWVFNGDNGVTELPGAIKAGSITYPATDGSAGQVLSTDGSGNLSWSSSSNNSNFVDLSSSQTVSGEKTFSPVLTAVADNSSLVGVNIDPQFNDGGYSGINKTALKLKGDLSFAEGANYLKFANGSMLGDVYNNGTDPSGTVDLFVPEGASWLELNYGNRNYFWMDNASAYLSTGSTGQNFNWTFNGNNGVTELPGAIRAGGITYPSADGSAGQVLSTDGSGALSWITPPTVNTSDFVDLTTNQTINGEKYFSQKIVVSNDVRIGNPGGDANIMLGSGSFVYAQPGNHNTAVGTMTLAVASGDSNTAIGSNAMRQGQTTGNGSNNTAIGSRALTNATDSNYNVAVGVVALENALGDKNTGIGSAALQGNNTGINNVGLGYRSGVTNAIGNDNTFLGSEADAASNSLSNVTAIGKGAIVDSSNTIQLGNSDITDVKTVGAITASGFKIASGTASQFLKADGSIDTNTYVASNTDNIAIGYVAGTGGQGLHSIAIGSNVAQGAQAEGGVGVGYAAAQYNQGENAVAIGKFAGQNNQAANSVAIGADTQVSGVNSVALGSGASVSTDNTIQLGNSSVTNVNTYGSITANAAISDEITTDLTIDINNVEQYKGRVLICNPSNSMTITFATGLPTGFNCMVLQKSADANKINLAGASGVTMKNRNNFTATAGNYAIATVVSIGGNILVTAGDMQ